MIRGTWGSATKRAVAMMDEGAEKNGESELPVRVARNGTFLWRVNAQVELNLDGSKGDQKHPLREHFQEVVKALIGDPRVSRVDEYDFEGFEYDSYRFYPIGAESKFREAITDADGFHVPSVSPALTFAVQVPLKNQSRRTERAEIPSERYVAAWDGITLIALWQQDSDELHPSAGDVVIEILRDAIVKVGDELLNQACSVGCENLFTHTTMVIQACDPSLYADQKAMAVKVSSRPGPRSVDVVVPTANDDRDVVEWLAWGIMLTGRYFARMKTLCARVLSLEDAARVEVAIQPG